MINNMTATRIEDFIFGQLETAVKHQRICPWALNKVYTNGGGREGILAWKRRKKKTKKQQDEAVIASRVISDLAAFSYRYFRKSRNFHW